MLMVISQTMGKGAFVTEKCSFLESIGKGIWDAINNSSYEPTKTKIKKIEVKEFSESRRLKQEERGYTNNLKFTVEMITRSGSKEENCTEDQYAGNSNNGELDLIAKRFYKFLMYKRKANMNFAGNKGFSRK